jgi:hypothetical protein
VAKYLVDKDVLLRFYKDVFVKNIIFSVIYFLSLAGYLYSMEMGNEGEKIEFLSTNSGSVVIAIFEDKLVTGDRSGLVKIWNIYNCKLLNEWQIHEKEEINSIAIAKDGKVATGSGAYWSSINSLKIWDINTGNILYTLDPDGHVKSVAIDDTKLITVTPANLKIWDINTGESIGQAMYTNSNHGYYVTVTITGNKMLVGDSSIYAKIFDITTGKLLYSLKDEKSSGVVASKAVDYSKIIIGLSDGRIKILDIENNRVLHALIAHTGRINSIATDNDKMVTGSSDGTVKIWNIHTAELLHTFKANTGYICSVAISGNKVVTGSSDGIVTIRLLLDEDGSKCSTQGL